MNFPKSFNITLLAIFISACFPYGLASGALPEIKTSNFRHITRREGLPSFEINVIKQDKLGFIWIGTENGLGRYDGHRTIKFESSNDNYHSINGNAITHIEVDSQNKVWVSTNKILDFYDYSTNYFTHIITRHSTFEGKMVMAIHDVKEDNGGMLWVSTNIGLLKFNLSGKLIKFYNKGSDILPIKRPIRLFIFSNSVLVSNYRNGLWQYDKETKKFTQFTKNINNINPETANIKDFIEVKHGVYWAATSKGIVIINKTGEVNKVINWENEKKLNSDRFYNIVLTPDKLIVASSIDDGLYVFNVKGEVIQHIVSQHENKYSLPSNGFNVLMLDKDKNLWVASRDSGLGVWKRSNPFISRIDFEKKNPDSILDGIVWSIREIKDQNGKDIFIVGTDSGLNLWNKKQKKFTHYRFGKTKSGSDVEVSAISEPIANVVWLATGIGLRAINISSKKIINIKEQFPFLQWAINQPIYNVFTDSTNKLWVVHRNGVTLVDFKHKGIKNFSHIDYDNTSIADNQAAAISEDPKSRVWLGASRGICQYKKTKSNFKCYLTDEGDFTVAGSYLVNGILVKENILWVGYSGNGLIRLDLSHPQSKPVYYNASKDFPTNNIAGLLMDKKGRLWISSQTGLIVFNPKNGQIINLKGRDGTGDSEFNDGAYTTLSDGRFAFGTIKGVVIVDPEKFEFNKTRPTVKFSGAYALTDNKLYSMGKHFEMPEKNSGLVLAFSIQDYFHPEQARYQYRLGHKKTWIDLKNKSEISFDGFSWGEHTIEVRGKYLGGEWGPTNSLSFYAYPPKWRSGFALFMYVLGALALMSWFLYYRFLQNKQKRHMLEVIKENEQQLRLSLDASQQGVWDWRIDFDRIKRSKTEELLHLKTPDTLVDYWSLIEDRDRLVVIKAWNNHLFGHTQDYYCQYRIKTTGDEEIWIEEQGRAIERNEALMAIHITGTYRNITEAKLIEKKLNLLAKAFEDTTEGVLIVDSDLNIVQVNNAVSEIMGYSEKQLIGESIRPSSFSHQPLAFYDEIWQKVAEKGLWQGEVWQTNADGDDIPLWLNVSDIQYEREQELFYVLIISDIRERKETEEELRYLANYDTLTKLPNRALLRDRLDHGLNNAKRQNRPIAILFLDLDRFKHVNDSFGHSVGDGLLIAVSERLQSCLRDDDTVSRIGGDEFVILMEHFSSINAIAGVTEKIRKAMSNPFNLEGVDIQASFSVGVSVFPGDGEDSASLLRNADTAMYHAKTAGRNRVQFYAPKMNETALERLTMENDLRSAIGSGQLEVYYQPQICDKDNSFYGVEALVRWIHPEKGMIAPVHFIPMAEESDLIVSLGNEVLYKACIQMKKWQDTYGLNMKVSINLAARQLLQLDLAKHIDNVVKRSRLSPEYVCLEITETAVMDDLKRSKKILNALRGKGYKIAIDDFGTGYSSLNYLRNIPLDILKIDYTFVRDLLDNSVDQAIVAAIIEIGEALDLQVLAEGIEQQEQRDFLSGKGCEYFQGYLFGRPMPAADFEKILAKNSKNGSKPPKTKVRKKKPEKTTKKSETLPNVVGET